MSAAKLYLEAGGWNRPRLFVRTGEFRAPRKGEFYLSGAIPKAWSAPNDLGGEYHILREATDSEANCSACHRRLPVQS